MAELKLGRFSALKDLVDTLNDHFTSGLISAEDLSGPIGNYVQSHEKKDKKKESRKILEELKDLVSRNTVGGNSKLPLLLICLKELREVLEPEDVVKVFEEAILQPILNPYGQNRQTLSDAKEVLLFCLVPPEDADGERRLFAIHYRLFDIYLRKQKDVLEGLTPIHTLPATKFTITTLEKVLVEFGDKCPKQFLSVVDKYYVSKENRLVAAGLLCRFAGAHDNHLDKVCDTDIIDHVLQCLEIDTSISIVTMSLTLLVMLLPNVCATMGQELPQLFFVLYRMLCWKKPTKELDNNESQMLEEPTWPLGHRRESWDAADTSDDSLRMGIPKAEHLFTFLYGLFPVNLIQFLQSPVDYLEQHHILLSSRDEDLFKSQAEGILARHTFNLDILQSTIESEIRDTSRWAELEPSEIASKCSSLDSANKIFSPKPERKTEPPSGPLPKPPASALTKHLDSESSRSFPFPPGDPMSPPVSSYTPRSRIGTMIASEQGDETASSAFNPPSHRITRNGSYSTTGTETIGFFGESEPIKPREFAADAVFSARTSQVQSDTSSTLEERKHSQDIIETKELELELKLLQAQIEFERLLKRRYLQQIARLQKKKVLQSTSDAEREQFVTEIADLKRQVEELMDALHRQHQSSAAYKQQRVAVEESLYQKIKVLGDDKNHYKNQLAQLQTEAETLRSEIKRLQQALKNQDRESFVDPFARESSTQSDSDSLRAEIEEWKDRAGSSRELESQKKTLEESIKRLETKLKIAEDNNRSMARQITQYKSGQHALMQQPPTKDPLTRSLLEQAAKEQQKETMKWRERWELLSKQYRSLEDTYRETLSQRSMERRNYEQLTSLESHGDHHTLGRMNSFDDIYSHDMPWDPSDPRGMSPGSSGTATSRGESGDPGLHHTQIPMVNSLAPQLRPSAATSSAGDSQNSFPHPPRRPTLTLSSRTAKISPHSEIRIYGRGGAQNMGMKTKKKEKTESLLG